MINNDHSKRETLKRCLKYSYKKYTNHIVNYEKHAEKLYNDWIIDLSTRNSILLQLDKMIQKMIKIYNIQIKKIYAEVMEQIIHPDSRVCLTWKFPTEQITPDPMTNSQHLSSDTTDSFDEIDTRSNSKTKPKPKPKLTKIHLSTEIDSIKESISKPMEISSRNHEYPEKIHRSHKQINLFGNSPDLLQTINTDYAVRETIYNGISMLRLLEYDLGPNRQEPFVDIRKDLLTLLMTNGSIDINEFFKIYLDDNHMSHFEHEVIEKIELFNKVFVPFSIKVTKLLSRSYARIDQTKSQMLLKKIPSEYDGLIDNTCKIIITMPALALKIVFAGYVSNDSLNIYVRTSQICSNFLFQVKSESRKLIKSLYPAVDDLFYSRYTKLLNGTLYLINTSEEFVEMIVSDYELYNSLVSKSFNIVVKEFVHGDIKNMYNMIILFLTGNEQQVSIAGLLFNSLKDKKISGENVADIIYHNLSYYAQAKLKKITTTIKSELTRLKTLTPDNISIEKRLAALLNMPDTVKSFILEKLTELKSGENNYKLQMGINGLMQFPWKPKNAKNEFVDLKKSVTKSREYLQNVAYKINETVYGHETSKKVLLELVGKWIQNPDSTGQVIGLVGPPGVGKTLLAKSISSALNIPLTVVGLGGMSDAADLIGHSFTYAGAQYGMIIRQMIKAGGWRCVMFFDEVDKVAKRNDTNEIYNTLIHITDPNMNQHFQDRFYSSSVEFDLSGVLIVFSYNSSDKLDPILLDRIKEIPISAYSVQEKIEIAKNYILKELCSSIGLNRNKIIFSNEIIKYVIEKYTVEAGVRELRRKLEQILLKLNLDKFYMRGPFIELMKKVYVKSKKFNPETNLKENTADTLATTGLVSYIDYPKHHLEKKLDEESINKIFNLEIDENIVITTDIVHSYLEDPLLTIDTIHNNDLIGVVNGLYATTIGIGGIIPIQVYKNYIGNTYSDGFDHPELKLKITGNQKQVMKESVICALTAAINVLNESVRDNITKNFPHGFHIHAPDGGTPKDGPSAGCAFTIAFVSILLGKKINRTIAMTGEIDLTGKISKIGSLEAKLYGAKKAGVLKVYICEDNRKDYDRIKKKYPDLFEGAFEVVVVEHIIDIITSKGVILGIEESDVDPNAIAQYISKKSVLC